MAVSRTVALVIPWDVCLPILRELGALRERQDAEVRRMVVKAVAAGARSQDIAAALGMSRSTLWRRYGDELRRDSPARPRR